MKTPRIRRRWIVLGVLAVAAVAMGATWYLWPTAEPGLRAKARLSCWGVGECADDCAKRCPSDLKKFSCMLSCAERCEARGCGGAAALHQALTACVKRRCLLSCLGGPDEGCHRCTLEKCREGSETCRAHRCAPE